MVYPFKQKPEWILVRKLAYLPATYLSEDNSALETLECEHCVRATKTKAVGDDSIQSRLIDS